MTSHKALALRRTLWQAYSGNPVSIDADSLVLRAPATQGLGDDDCLALGYTPVGHGLMESIASKPYINLQNAFLALLPNHLPQNLKIKLLNFYNEKIKKNPEKVTK